MTRPSRLTPRCRQDTQEPSGLRATTGEEHSASGVELRGITPNQQSTGTTRAAGSPAEREYAAAVKELARLQRNLASSAAGGDTSEEKLAADQQAVTLAAARVAAAPAAVAQEKQEAAEQKAARTEAPAPSVTTADLVAEQERDARLSRVDRTV